MLSLDKAGLRRAGRFANPTTLVLVLVFFTFPFVSVSCSTPGGFARAERGGTTSYNGYALAVGGEPDVTAENRRSAPATGESDDLPPQPAVAVVLLLVVASIGFAIWTKEPRRRRASVAVLAGVAATALLVGQALVVAELTVRVSDHLSRLVSAGRGADLEPGKSAHDYVQTGAGFVVTLLLLLVVVAGNGVAWWRARPRAALVAEERS